MAVVLVVDGEYVGLEAVLKNLRLDCYCGVVLANGRHACGGRIAPVPKSELERFGISANGRRHPVFLVMRHDDGAEDRSGLVTCFRVIPWSEVARVFQCSRVGYDNLLGHFEKV